MVTEIDGCGGGLDFKDKALLYCRVRSLDPLELMAFHFAGNNPQPCSALTSCIDMTEDEVEDKKNPRCGPGREVQLDADLEWLRRGPSDSSRASPSESKSRIAVWHGAHINQAKCRAFCWALREALEFKCALCSGSCLCICLCA